MRLIKSLPHPEWKLDLFHNQANYLLQISAGTVQISYKFARSNFSPQQIEEMTLNKEFMMSSRRALEILLTNQIRMQPSTQWDEEEII